MNSSYPLKVEQVLALLYLDHQDLSEETPTSLAQRYKETLEQIESELEFIPPKFPDSLTGRD